MTKNYVLDTNVLLHDPRALYAFEDNNVIIPIYVIDEIDTFKKDQSELGRNARQIARLLDSHRSGGSLARLVPLETGGHLMIALGSRSPLEPARDAHKMDNLILEVALEVRDSDHKTPTFLVTKDVNMRIRGDALGLRAVDYEDQNISLDELYPGSSELSLDGAQIDRFYADNQVAVPDDLVLTANQYVLLRNRDNPGQTALARFDKASGHLVPIRKLRDGVWGIRPRNKEQHYALDLLLNDDVKLVTLVGKAGTGKTLLALAAGLQKVIEEQSFHKLLVSRPIFPLGRDIGYLPGDIEEKLNPWMQPIYDNLELLLGLVEERHEGRPQLRRAVRAGLRRDRAA